MRTILATLLVLFAYNTWAWGPQGHMIVAQIGENNLTPKAKSAINSILKGQTLASVANWPDVIKGKPEWVHTKSWHFVDIPDGQDYSNAEHNHDGDVVGAITDMVKILKQNNADSISRENALKFLVHFVGDIHQPLHVGRPDDRGGNDVRIVFEGKNSNLHALWDGLMIQKTPMNYRDYANWLENGKSLIANYDIPGFPFSTIIAEDMSARDEIYDFSPTVEGPVKVTAAYYQRNVDLMNHQLLTGGKRLATLLNTIFK